MRFAHWSKRAFSSSATSAASADRVYEASRVLDLFTELERALARPPDDTLVDRPE